MNKNLNHIGILVTMVPLFAVGLTLGYVGDAFAANVGSQDVNGRPGYQPDKVCGDRLCSDSPSASSEKSEKKLSKSTGSTEFDALSIQYAEKTQELSIASANGDSDKVAELQHELKDLRNQIVEWKNN